MAIGLCSTRFRCFLVSKKANLLSAKSSGASYSQSRTDTLIGAGVRIDGNLSFTGVLRIQGVALGDISCDVDSIGTIVVGKSGSVTGTVKAPYIVVGGCVSGPLHSSASIEIQPGAHVAGDAFYKLIDIHAGGVMDGSLTPMASTDLDRLQQEQGTQPWSPSAVGDYDTPIANAGAADGTFVASFGGKRNWFVALMIAVVLVVLGSRYFASIMPPAVDAALKANSSAQEVSAAPSEPGGGAPRSEPKAVTGDAAPHAPDTRPNTENAVAAPPPGLGEMIPENVVLVQGVNPGKPSGVFSVVGREPSVLFRKNRHDPGDGTRIDISQGAAVSIAIAKNEIFRVAKGKNIEIYYQGRKVAPKTTESGAWMSFVPQLPAGTTEGK
ncbi:MAG: polymer-forming cytoskeletal protein [Sulfuritalea sp.]|nr:polymer-forming cytoskeletal protein [Sulfuritalea sp.]